MRPRIRSTRFFLPSTKALGGSIGRLNEPFDPDALDGDEDGIIQDGTPWERPGTPGVPNIPGRTVGANRLDDIRSRSMTDGGQGGSRSRRDPEEDSSESRPTVGFGQYYKELENDFVTPEKYVSEYIFSTKKKKNPKSWIYPDGQIYPVKRTHSFEHDYDAAFAEGLIRVDIWNDGWRGSLNLESWKTKPTKEQLEALATLHEALSSIKDEKGKTNPPEVYFQHGQEHAVVAKIDGKTNSFIKKVEKLKFDDDRDSEDSDSSRSKREIATTPDIGDAGEIVKQDDSPELVPETDITLDDIVDELQEILTPEFLEEINKFGEEFMDGSGRNVRKTVKNVDEWREIQEAELVTVAVLEPGGSSAAMPTKYTIGSPSMMEAEERIRGVGMRAVQGIMNLLSGSRENRKKMLREAESRLEEYRKTQREVTEKLGLVTWARKWEMRFADEDSKKRGNFAKQLYGTAKQLFGNHPDLDPDADFNEIAMTRSEDVNHIVNKYLLDLLQSDVFKAIDEEDGEERNIFVNQIYTLKKNIEEYEKSSREIPEVIKEDLVRLQQLLDESMVVRRKLINQLNNVATKPIDPIYDEDITVEDLTTESGKEFSRIINEELLPISRKILLQYRDIEVKLDEEKMDDVKRQTGMSHIDARDLGQIINSGGAVIPSKVNSRAVTANEIMDEIGRLQNAKISEVIKDIERRIVETERPALLRRIFPTGHWKYDSKTKKPVRNARREDGSLIFATPLTVLFAGKSGNGVIKETFEKALESFEISSKDVNAYLNSYHLSDESRDNAMSLLGRRTEIIDEMQTILRDVFEDLKKNYPDLAEGYMMGGLNALKEIARKVPESSTSQKWNDYMQKMVELNKELQKISSDLIDVLSPEEKDKLKKLQEDLEQAKVKKGDFILEKISSLSAEIDELLADKPLTFSQEFKKSLINILEEMGISPSKDSLLEISKPTTGDGSMKTTEANVEKFKQHISEIVPEPIIQLLNLFLKNNPHTVRALTVDEAGTKGGHWSRNSRQIATNFEQRTNLHEFMHMMSTYFPFASMAEQAFLYNRGLRGEKGSSVEERMADLDFEDAAYWLYWEMFGGSKPAPAVRDYSSSHYYIEDEFDKRYTGRIYAENQPEDFATEVLSTGIEFLADTYTGTDFPDYEHLALVIGVLITAGIMSRDGIAKI